MAIYWSKVDGVFEKHEGRKSQLRALIRINFAVQMSGKTIGECGIYRKDPAKFPDAENVLPAMLAKHTKARARISPKSK